MLDIDGMGNDRFDVEKTHTPTIHTVHTIDVIYT